MDIFNLIYCICWYNGPRLLSYYCDECFTHFDQMYLLIKFNDILMERKWHQGGHVISVVVAADYDSFKNGQASNATYTQTHI